MAIILVNANAKRIPLPDESVHCVITSPPYWSLRDYGVIGQIGLETSPQEYIDALVAAFREVWRVMRRDGTLWLNLGDSYYSNPGNGRGGGSTLGGGKPYLSGANRVTTQSALKSKDLCMIPARVALALQADGWWLRSDIIWSKVNPMPESVQDRPTTAHEHIFLLAKASRYFYDIEAIKEPVAESTIGRGPVDFGGAKGRNYQPEKGDPNYRGGNEQWGRTFDYTESCVNDRNRRTVWEIPTTPYPGAHFATFPPALVEPCIKAGTSERGCCPECGAPWGRVKEPTPEYAELLGKDWANYEQDERDGRGHFTLPDGGKAGQRPVKRNAPSVRAEYVTTGWRPTCTCDAGDPVPCTVLDPFVGSGTTLLVARRLGRHGIGLDLSYPYLAEQARERLGLRALDEWQHGRDQIEPSTLDGLPLFDAMQ